MSLKLNFVNILENLGLKDVTVYSAKKSREIFDLITLKFLNAKSCKEIIEYPSFIQSDLLRKIYLDAFGHARNYVYTAEKGIHQLVKMNARQSLTKCLSIAKESIEKTCYIVCCDLTYYLRIRYQESEGEAADQGAYHIEVCN